MINEAIQLPSLDGLVFPSGIQLIGEPTPVVGTNKLRCLANHNGALVVVELALTFRTGWDCEIQNAKGGE